MFTLGTRCKKKNIKKKRGWRRELGSWKKKRPIGEEEGQEENRRAPLDFRAS